VDPLLLTVLGFVVALSLSFRSTTAYERYNEGRKYWALLTLHARQLAHVIWIYGKERDGELEKDDILGKVSAINLILAFAMACKHRLRHEIEYDYTDLKPLVDHLDTFAKSAQDVDPPANLHNQQVQLKKRTSFGEFLGVSFMQRNPKKVYKVAARKGKQHGNLPYEIVAYIGQYIKNSLEQGTFDSGIIHGQVYNAFNNLMDAYGGCDRVLQTPLPLAYSKSPPCLTKARYLTLVIDIAISQITWLYVLVLPFQLFSKLGWVAIPGTVVAGKFPPSHAL
jgi:putative membrane protein